MNSTRSADVDVERNRKDIAIGRDKVQPHAAAELCHGQIHQGFAGAKYNVVVGNVGCGIRIHPFFVLFACPQLHVEFGAGDFSKQRAEYRLPF